MSEKTQVSEKTHHMELSARILPAEGGVGFAELRTDYHMSKASVRIQKGDLAAWHNHPNGSYFSVKDITLGIDKNINMYRSSVLNNDISFFNYQSYKSGLVAQFTGMSLIEKFGRASEISSRYRANQLSLVKQRVNPHVTDLTR